MSEWEESDMSEPVGGKFIPNWETTSDMFSIFFSFAWNPKSIKNNSKEKKQ
jgi:hypothetical protein